MDNEFKLQEVKGNAFDDEVSVEPQNEEINIDGGSGELNETRAEKFLRIAPSRIDKVIHSLDILGNLAGSSYEYTPEQVEKMFAAIQTKMDSTKSRFEREKKTDDKFSF